MMVSLYVYAKTFKSWMTFYEFEVGRHKLES